MSGVRVSMPPGPRFCSDILVMTPDDSVITKLQSAVNAGSDGHYSYSLIINDLGNDGADTGRIEPRTFLMLAGLPDRRTPQGGVRNPAASPGDIPGALDPPAGGLGPASLPVILLRLTDAVKKTGQAGMHDKFDDGRRA
jgi:hypothetical protein